MPQHSSSLSNERNRLLAGCQAVCTITKPIVGGGSAECAESAECAAERQFVGLAYSALFRVLRLRIHLWLKKCLDKDYFPAADASLVGEMLG